MHVVKHEIEFYLVHFESFLNLVELDTIKTINLLKQASCVFSGYCSRIFDLPKFHFSLVHFTRYSVPLASICPVKCAKF